MARAIDITNERFGRLIARRRFDKWKNHWRWECHCDCGSIFITQIQYLRNGSVRSCGCMKGTHGACRNGERSAEYACWRAMRQRCNNSDHPAFKYYGGRGIKVCERWNHFENFYADMGSRPDGLTLDRIDTDKGYGPKNCRWATRLEQVKNRRRYKRRRLTSRNSGFFVG